MSVLWPGAAQVRRAQDETAAHRIIMVSRRRSRSLFCRFQDFQRRKTSGLAKLEGCSLSLWKERGISPQVLPPRATPC